MVRTSLPANETSCLHPEIEQNMLKWLKLRAQPAFLLIGPPGVGKTTLSYRVCRDAQYWVQEFNASHTRTGSSFRQTIMPLLTEKGVSKWIHPSTPNGRVVLLDEMDGLSQGEKGGLQELLDYLKAKRSFIDDCPLILICNILEGRIMQQLIKYCNVNYVNMPQRDKLITFFKRDIPDKLYQLGDIRKVHQSLFFNDKTERCVNEKEDTLDKSIHIAIRAAWFTLFESWNETDELDLETKDANLAGLLFHQNVPLYLDNRLTMPNKKMILYKTVDKTADKTADKVTDKTADKTVDKVTDKTVDKATAKTNASFDMYDTILGYLRWSDRADFWAFFHQCWNLLPLSYRLKLKYPNLYIQHYQRPIIIPKPSELQYTQVLTKQSALFNAWKEMNRVSNEYHIPFRCVTQWATHQTGKIYDTLGVNISIPEFQNSNGLSVNVMCAPIAEPTELKHSSVRRRVACGKKLNAK
jgi:DNA polymerase III delta prime subunit